MVQYKSDCVSLKSIEIYDTILTFLMVGRWSLTLLSTICWSVLLVEETGAPRKSH
jgi:hypothetical protein